MTTPHITRFSLLWLVPIITTSIAIAAEQAIPDSETVAPAKLPPLSEPVRRSMITFANGMMAYQKGDYDKAARAFEQAVSINPNDPQFHYMLGETYGRLDRFRLQWLALRQTLKLKPDHSKALQDFNNMWQTAVDKGVLDVGSSREQIQAALGPPDGSQQQGERSLWAYAYNVVEFHRDQVVSVIDMRGSESFQAPQDAVKLAFDERPWKLKQRSASRTESMLIFAPETESASTERLTLQRLVDLKQNLGVAKLMQRMRDNLQLQFPEVTWKLISESDDEIVFEWWLSSENAPQQYEITRLLTGVQDIHRISYSTDQVPLDATTRSQWVELLGQARLIEGESG